MTKAVLILIALTGTATAQPQTGPFKASAVAPGETWHCDHRACGRDPGWCEDEDECTERSRAAVFTAWHVLDERDAVFSLVSIAMCKRFRAHALTAMRDDYKRVSQCKVVGPIKEKPGKFTAAALPANADWWCFASKDETAKEFRACRTSEIGCDADVARLGSNVTEGCTQRAAVHAFTFSDDGAPDYHAADTAEACKAMQARSRRLGATKISACAIVKSTD